MNAAGNKNANNKAGSDNQHNLAVDKDYKTSESN